MLENSQHIVDSMAYSTEQMNALLMEQNSTLNTISQNVSAIMENGTDYTPEIKVFAIPLIIAIFTIMGPLLFSIVNRIDSKYKAKQFIKFYFNNSSVTLFVINAIISILAIVAYAIFREKASELFWNILLCSFAIILLGLAILTFLRALKFNNSQKLLSEIFSKYRSGLCRDSKREDFYSLCTHIAHYAIVSDITLLHDFVNRYAKEHILKTSAFTENLYVSLIDIAADYKEKEDDLEVNDALAFLFASLVDSSADGETTQDTYNALFQILCICNRNKHYSLINVFQRKMRYAYYAMYKNAQNKGQERANRLQLFVLALNALLYGKGSMECVEDAINHNNDTVIIGNEVIIPYSSNHCLDLYLHLREVLRDSKEFAYYYYVASDFTSYTNATQLNRSFAGYFAYLIMRQHSSKLAPHDLVNSVCIRESNIIDGFDVLIKNAPDEVIKKRIQSLQKAYWKCRNKCIIDGAINIEKCENVITKQIKDKQLDVTFKGIATYNPIYMKDAKDCYLPIMTLNAIPRVTMMERNLSSDCTFYEKYDFGSRVIECLMDALADIYNSFERIEETIQRKDIEKRWLDLIGKYDYSFLTFDVSIPNRAIPIGEKFNSYFTAPSMIAIPIRDLPYIEWKEDCKITSFTECASGKMPQMDVTTDVHMSIHYKRNTKIHVLKVVD